MLRRENLAANFCGLLAVQKVKGKAIEWRIVGQERDGSLLTTCILQENGDEDEKMCIYHFNVDKSLYFLHSLPRRQNIIQASINSAISLMIYTVKSEDDEFENDGAKAYAGFVYQAFIVELNQQNAKPLTILCIPEVKQVMVQFLWKKPTTSDSSSSDSFLLLTHEKSILQYSLKKGENCVNEAKCSKDKTWNLEDGIRSGEIITKCFTWAQWDADNQTLYYIHFKQKIKSVMDEDRDNALSPTLSALQFHENGPTETVLNIPLNLPNLPKTFFSPENEYEDDPVPLRIHDSSINLVILTEESGMLFVCHHYLYQPFTPKDVDEETSSNNGNNEQIHFAYSVTILHHGCVIHCVIPGISLERAKRMKPTFTLYGNHHVLVFQPDLFSHLLDIGLSHEPCCHIASPAHNHAPLTQLIPCPKWGMLAYDSATLDLVSLKIPKSHLINAFRSDTSIANRLSLVHYFLIHSTDNDALVDLLKIIIERPFNSDIVTLFKEILIAGSYAETIKELPQDALKYIRLLPLTTSPTSKPIQARTANVDVGISHEKLWNTNMMLLSPQQRLSPYRTDFWTQLWEKLNETDQKENKRFCPEDVVKKLMYSLSCYQPEALSRCTTPMSPTRMFKSLNFSDQSASVRWNCGGGLPFVEVESSTATKQEHVISVNMRELSVHLVKNTTQHSTGFRWLKDALFERSQTPAYINVIASTYVKAQLELSRTLCSLICSVVGIDSHTETVRGFHLINKIDDAQAYSLFLILERYCLAVDSVAFPIPQGFGSFFTYLGYKTLSFELFLQYVENHVFELHFDAVKAILNDIDDSKSGIEKKFVLLSALPKSRSQRLFKSWNHSEALLRSGREHAANILAGKPIQKQRTETRIQLHEDTKAGVEKLSPLDSFLNLLTAKANLSDLDFNLLIESTVVSLNNLRK